MSINSENQSAILEVTSESKRISSTCNNKSETHFTKSTVTTDESEFLQSPSGENISTLQEFNKNTDLILENGRDIIAHVDEPQKVIEPWGTYVTFRIRTKTTRWNSVETEYSVRRRYNDFKALREKMVETSLQIIPPIPSPHTIMGQLDRYSKDFVLQRMALLNIFIKRLVLHSILSYSNDLKVFLIASTSEFTQYFKLKSSYLASLSDSLCNLTSPNVGYASLSSITCKIKNPEFSIVYDYMMNLQEKLTLFNNISSRITKERSDISTEMKSINPILECWSQMESFNRDTLKRKQKRPLNNSYNMEIKFCLGNILDNVAKPFSIIATEHYIKTKEYPYIIANPLKEYLLYIEAVKEKLSKRDALQASLEGAQDKFAKKKDKCDLGNVSVIQQTSPCLPKLAQEVDNYHDRLQCASEALRSDICGWQKQKKTDMKMILIEMVNREIDFYEKSLSAWQSVLIN